jgi:hypothetical protein
MATLEHPRFASRHNTDEAFYWTYAAFISLSVRKTWQLHR